MNVTFTGILEFDPKLAGQDVTPANLEFGSLTYHHRERREKSSSSTSALKGNQLPLCFHQSSLYNAVNDDLIPLTHKCQSFDPYQSSIEYRLQELTKRLSTLETKLIRDVSSVLSILQHQFPTSNLPMSSSSIDALKTNP